MQAVAQKIDWIAPLLASFAGFVALYPSEAPADTKAICLLEAKPCQDLAGSHMKPLVTRLGEPDYDWGDPPHSIPDIMFDSLAELQARANKNCDLKANLPLRGYKKLFELERHGATYALFAKNKVKCAWIRVH